MAKRRKTDFPAWVERSICLPPTLSAHVGRITLPIYLRAIAASMDDPSVEKLVIQKSARLGYSTLLMSLVAYHFSNKPGPILAVLPCEADARTMIVSLEEIFDGSPDLKGKLPNPSVGRREGRNTILFRRGANGASLRAVGAGAPRNLRSIAAKILLVDEMDSLEDSEGDAVSLAISRTLTFPDRRIIVGGTPQILETSRVCKAYGETDQHVYEVRCPACHGFAEMQWAHIEWPEGRPQEARWRCPLCAALIDETRKQTMVEAGRWRATRPDAPAGQRGYRLSCLVSSLPHATWGKAAATFEAARGDDERMQVFYNDWLGLPWAADEGGDLDEAALAARAEPFSLDEIPREVLLITLGADVQGDRLEASVVGWGRDGTCFVLDHRVLWGPPVEDDEVWRELDDLLHAKWKHPLGGEIGIGAAAIDAGSGVHYDRVLAFCAPRLGRKVFALKGLAGWARPAIARAKTRGKPLFLAGVDPLKGQIFAKLDRGRGIRFSHVLEPSYYEMLTSERRVTRIVGGRPRMRFERKLGAKAETLDALAYATAARAALHLDAAAFSQREDSLRRAPDAPPPKPRPAVIHSKWMERQRVRREW